MCFGTLHVHFFSRHGDSLNLCSLRRRELLRIAFSSPHLFADFKMWKSEGLGLLGWGKGCCAHKNDVHQRKVEFQNFNLIPFSRSLSFCLFLYINSFNQLFLSFWAQLLVTMETQWNWSGCTKCFLNTQRAFLFIWCPGRCCKADRCTSVFCQCYH